MAEEITSIMDDSIYLARDFSSIIKWFTGKLKFLTTKWTDLSVTEPDTLTLSQIAYIFDLVNYTVDKKYLSTILTYTQSIQFLSYLYKLIGEELLDYTSETITLSVYNTDEEADLVIDKHELMYLDGYPNELVSAVKRTTVHPLANADIEVVRGVPKYLSFITSEINSGIITLPKTERINRKSISVYLNGEEDLEQVDDALFSDAKTFSIHQTGTYGTFVRLSPKACRFSDIVIVAYCVNDTYPIAYESNFILMEEPDGDYEITNETSLSDSDVQITDMKKRFYELLRKVSSLYNNSYDPNLLINDVEQIDYLDYKYTASSLFRDGTIDYGTGLLVLNMYESDLNLSIRYNTVTEEEVREEHVYSYTTSDIYAAISLPLDEGQEVEPMSVYVTTENTILSDTDGTGVIKQVRGNDIRLKVNYSTTDGNPITGIVRDLEIDYTTTAATLSLNYISTTPFNVVYSYAYPDHDPEVVTDDYQLSDLENYLLFSVPREASLVPGSIKITHGDDIIIDNGEGGFEVVQTAKSKLLNNFSEVTLLGVDTSQIVLQRLSTKLLNIDAIVHLKTLNTNTEVVENDINTVLEVNYAKGIYKPGATIKRLPLLLAMEQSNPNIDYITLNQPQFDVPTDSNQIPELGTVNLTFERV